MVAEGCQPVSQLTKNHPHWHARLHNSHGKHKLISTQQVLFFCLFFIQLISCAVPDCPILYVMSNYKVTPETGLTVATWKNESCTTAIKVTRFENKVLKNYLSISASDWLKSYILYCGKILQIPFLPTVCASSSLGQERDLIPQMLFQPRHQLEEVDVKVASIRRGSVTGVTSCQWVGLVAHIYGAPAHYPHLVMKAGTTFESEYSVWSSWYTVNMEKL